MTLGRCLSLASLACALLSACTPTVNRLEPYRDDAVAATALERQASAECALLHSAVRLPPHPFTTDGCSFWLDSDWVECCVAHDILYWCGGTCEERAAADDGLRQCVADRASSAMATTMYIGVRLGGPPWTGLPSRWGYGWDWPHGYDEETPASVPVK